MKKNDTPKTGSMILIKLENGDLMPFQIVRQKENDQISTCAIIGRTYALESDARAHSKSWSEADVVAEMNTLTKNIFDHDGEPWIDLGQQPLIKTNLKKPVTSKIADAIRAKLGVKNEETPFASIGLFYSLANACAGTKPWNSMAKPDYFAQFVTDPGHPLLKRVMK